MTLKIFSDRQWKEFKEIYCWSLKQRFGIMLLYMTLLFTALPMILLLVIANTQQRLTGNMINGVPVDQMAETLSNMLKMLLPFLVVPITLLFVLILSVMLYHYMHQKRSVDYFHSLPVGRVTLMLGKYFAGLTMVFVPLIINFGIVAIIIRANHLDFSIPISSLLFKLLWVMFMVTAAFSFMVLMAVCSGTTMDMVISAIVINISYPILIILCQHLATCILPGLDLGNNFISLYTVAFAPFAASFVPFLPANYSASAMCTSFTVWWAVLTLILFFGNIVLYRKRKSETAENNFAFPLPKIIIRFVTTAAVGMGLGMIFYQVTRSNSQSSFFLGVFAGSLVTHIIAEAIYSRGFKSLKKSFVYYGAFVVLFLGGYLSLSFGFFGYDTRLPATENIASVDIDMPNYSNMCGMTYVSNERGDLLTTITPQLKKRNNIDMVRGLHQTIINTNKKSSYPYKINNHNYENIAITYHLKNGHTLCRNYNEFSCGENKNISNLCLIIQNQEEYKTNGSLIFYMEPSFIKQIRIPSNTNTGSTFDSGNDIKLELINALKQDIKEFGLTSEYAHTNLQIELTLAHGFVPSKGNPLKEQIGNYNGKVSFSYQSYFNDNTNFDYYISIPNSYKSTMALLNKYGFIKK